MNDNFKIFKYITKILDQSVIEQFDSYSKKFEIIIELDRFYDSSEDYYIDVKNIIDKEFIVNIEQDSQNFLYTNEKDERKEISMEDLIKLKNKLHNINEKEKGKESNNITSSNIKKPKDSNDEMNKKREKLLFFKKIISNIELIVNEYMRILRTKGSSLPIKIMIKINKNDIKYFLGEKERF